MNHLKNAEQKASELVSAAKNNRTTKIREAKAEAEAEIARYRAEQEATYQAALAKTRGGAGDNSAKLQQQTNGDISQLTREFNSNKETVEKKLVDLVLDVHIVAPEVRN
jgi:V-type H+-transporting ATPase subunit G